MEFRYIDASKIAQELGYEKASWLTLFHTFTGCDMASSLHCIGKKSALKAWDVCGKALTRAFPTL